MNLGPTTNPRTFHFMTRKGDHKLIDTVYAAKSVEEAVKRVVQADGNIPEEAKQEVGMNVMLMLDVQGIIIFNSPQSVIIVH